MVFFVYYIVGSINHLCRSLPSLSYFYTSRLVTDEAMQVVLAIQVIQPI